MEFNFELVLKENLIKALCGNIADRKPVLNMKDAYTESNSKIGFWQNSK